MYYVCMHVVRAARVFLQTFLSHFLSLSTNGLTYASPSHKRPCRHFSYVFLWSFRVCFKLQTEDSTEASLTDRGVYLVGYVPMYNKVTVKYILAMS